MTAIGYHLHGLDVLSPVPLPERARAQVDPRDAVVVHDLGVGEVAGGIPENAELVNMVGNSPMLTLERCDRGWELRCPEFMSFTISEALDRIDVVLAPECNPGYAPLLLAGAGLATVATLRGKVVIHASAISTARGVVAFAGPSGHGKSTTAALVGGAGAPVFADDVLALDLTTPIVAHRGITVTRLRGNRAELPIVRATSHVEQTVDGRLALHLPQEPELELPLAAVVMPALSTDAERVSVEVLDTAPAFQALARCMRLNGWQTAERKREAIANTAALAERVTIAVATIPTGRSLKSHIGLELLEALDGLN